MRVFYKEDPNTKQITETMKIPREDISTTYHVIEEVTVPKNEIENSASYCYNEYTIIHHESMVKELVLDASIIPKDILDDIKGERVASSESWKAFIDDVKSNRYTIDYPNKTVAGNIESYNSEFDLKVIEIIDIEENGEMFWHEMKTDSYY